MPTCTCTHCIGWNALMDVPIRVGNRIPVLQPAALRLTQVSTSSVIYTPRHITWV